MKTEYDLGQVIGRIEAAPALEAASLLQPLPTAAAAEALVHIPDAKAAQILGRMPRQTAAQILSAMPPDDRVDCLILMVPDLHEALVALMEAPQAAETRQLEQYPPDTAGGIMTTRFTCLAENLTVEQAIATLRSIHEETGEMFYVYVVDENRRLVGVLSMRDLILARRRARCGK